MKAVLAGILACLLIPSVNAAEQGHMRSTTVMRDQPNHHGAAVATLAQSAPVTIEIRSAGWLQVKNSRQQTGWVSMANVQLQSLSWRKKTRGLFRWLGGGNTAQATSSTGMITVGIRGLADDDDHANEPTSIEFAQAEPNYNALAALEKNQISPAAAREHAHEQQLITRQVAP